MGTNFYARKKLEKSERQKLHQKLDEFLSGEIGDYEFKEALELEVPEIHLGKRSGGWQFLWQANPDYYQENLKSIISFLESGEYEILDEYGESYTPSKFLYSEISECLYSGYTHKTYQKDHPEEMPIPENYHDRITSDGLRFVSGDFS